MAEGIKVIPIIKHLCPDCGHMWDLTTLDGFVCPLCELNKNKGKERKMTNLKITMHGLKPGMMLTKTSVNATVSDEIVVTAVGYEGFTALDSEGKEHYYHDPALDNYECMGFMESSRDRVEYLKRFHEKNHVPHLGNVQTAYQISRVRNGYEFVERD